jgi:hypothetical protein
MNPEKLLSNLEKIYGNNGRIETNAFNKRPALPAEIKEVIDKARNNGNQESDKKKDSS